MARNAMHLARKEAPAARAGAQDRSERGSLISGAEMEIDRNEQPEFGGLDAGRNFAPAG